MKTNKLYEDSIILIGPSGAGKSTIASDIEERLKMPRVCLDKLTSIARKSGYRARFKTSDEFNSHMIHTLVEEAKTNASNTPYVVDFGAGHSIYKDKEIFKRVKQDLKPFKNVVLLLPCKDEKKALEIMAERSTGDTSENLEFLRNPCNKELATMVVYAEGRTPQEITEEIMNRIQKRKEQDKENWDID